MEALLATRFPRQMDLFTTALAIFFVHVFGHVALPLFMRAYTLGVITAVLVVLPYSLYGFHRLFAARLIDNTNFTTTLLIGALLFVPLILAANLLGKLLIRH